MSTDFAALFDLPWRILLALGGGYLGYALAYMGIRSHHKDIDVAFITFVFALITLTTTNIAFSMGVPHPAAAGAIALLIVLVMAAIWRMWGMRITQNLIMSLGISRATDMPTGWHSLFMTDHLEYTSLAVYLDDGARLLCKDTSQYKDRAMPPLTLGPDGSILMYVSDVKVPKADGSFDDKPQNSTLNDTYGDRITYIPSGKIRRVLIRQRKKGNRSA